MDNRAVSNLFLVDIVMNLKILPFTKLYILLID